MNARRGDVGCLCHEPGAGARNRAEQRALFVDLTSGRQDLFGDVLVQKRLGGANAGIRMETPAHRVGI
jgi:hypothetical protein